MRNKLPDRWMDYTKMGEVVSGTRFLPVKVPLKSSLTRFLPKEQWFSPGDLMDLAKKKGITIGLVIDLTYTSRYYCSDDFTRFGIKYFKIFMPGRQVPDKKIMTQFYDVVLKFQNENTHNNHSIVVHCTHGLNRTGYMICKFMTEKLNMSVDNAIAKFNKARGHDIEREIYLNDLKSLNSHDLRLEEEKRGVNGSNSHDSYVNTGQVAASLPKVPSHYKHSTPFHRSKAVTSAGSSFHHQSSYSHYSDYNPSGAKPSYEQNYTAPNSSYHTNSRGYKPFNQENHKMASSSKSFTTSSDSNYHTDTSSNDFRPSHQQIYMAASSKRYYNQRTFPPHQSGYDNAFRHKEAPSSISYNYRTTTGHFQSNTQPIGPRSFQHKYTLAPHRNSYSQKPYFPKSRSHERYKPYHTRDAWNDEYELHR